MRERLIRPEVTRVDSFKTRKGRYPGGSNPSLSTLVEKTAASSLSHESVELETDKDAFQPIY